MFYILLHFHKLCSNQLTNMYKRIKICSGNWAFFLEKGKVWGLKFGNIDDCVEEKFCQGETSFFFFFSKLKHPTSILPFIFSQVIPFICIFFYLPLP